MKKGSPPQLAKIEERSDPDNLSLMNLLEEFGKVEKEFSHLRGICSICEDRATCTFPKPEGGVWHCEEYR